MRVNVFDSVYYKIRFFGGKIVTCVNVSALGSLLKGVLQIYGTTNELLDYYWLVGAGFAGLGAIFYFAQKKAITRT